MVATTIIRPDSDRQHILVASAVAALALGVRFAMAPQLDGLDDAGYLEAALRVAHGRDLENMFVLFRTRVGMAYPFGWLLQLNVLAPAQFWMLTLFAETVTLGALFAGTWWLTGTTRAAMVSVILYSVYPFAVQQSVMFYPSAFQTMFIALAIALISGAERGAIRYRTIATFAAGASLGLAYLVKEDAALLVPAFIVASIVAGFPGRAAVLLVSSGAAVVFFAECAGYLVTTGNPLFRLSASSGLGGSTISDQLQISDIFKWDAYIRSLYLMPIQVGVHWWFLIPAVWIAVRRGDAGLRFVAVTFVIVATYLQFGSDSISNYAPLPKTPRYTVILTPLIMVTLGSWVAWLSTSGRRAAAVVAIAAMVAAAIPCVIFLNISSSERSRNTLAVVDTLRGLPEAPLYTDFYSARALRILAPERRDLKTWYHADFQKGAITVQGDPDQHVGAYVLLDLQSAKIYTSSYQMTLPAEITGRHANWEVVWTGQAYESGSPSRRLLELIRTATLRVLPASTFSQRVQRSVKDIIDGDEATLFRVTRKTS